MKTTQTNSKVLFTLALTALLTACGGGGGGGGGGGNPTPIKAWQIAELIGTDNAGDAFSPQIAFDSNGNAMAVWQQDDGTQIIRDSIWANRFDSNTNTWQAPELIETDDKGNASSPQIAFDSNGNAMAVWQQYDGTRTNIWAKSFDSSKNTWKAAKRIDANGANAGNARNPQIAFDSNGNAMAVWYQHDASTGYNIWANRFYGSANTANTANTANIWEGAKLIETDEGNALDPQIAFDSNGNAMAVWRQNNGDRYNILANRFDSNTNAWQQAPELIGTDDKGSARYPQIAFDSNGNAMAVWYKHDGSTGYNIWANRFYGSPNAAKAWEGAKLIETDNKGDALDPQIAFDSNGNAMAVWRQDNGTSYNILANRFDSNTNTWQQAPELIETDEGNAYFPQIAFDSNGNAMAVWQQYDYISGHENIWANRFYSSTKTWGGAKLIETDDKVSRYPQIAFDSNGNAMAVWVQYDNARTNIWANYFK